MQIMSLGEHYILHLNNMIESNSIVAKVLIRFHEMIIIWGHKQRSLYDLPDTNLETKLLYYEQHRNKTFRVSRLILVYYTFSPLQGICVADRNLISSLVMVKINLNKFPLLSCPVGQ